MKWTRDPVGSGAPATRFCTFSVPCDQAGESCPLERSRESGQRSVCPAAGTARLHEHPFAGNVRELRNVLERAALLTDGSTIEREPIERALAADAAPPVAAAPDARAPGAGQSLREVEPATLRAQIEAHRGSHAELAAKLGISERSLYRKLHALDKERR